MQAWQRVLDHQPSPSAVKDGPTVAGACENTRHLLLNLAYAAQYQYHVDLMVPTWEICPHFKTDPTQTQVKADTRLAGAGSEAEAATRKPDTGPKADAGLHVDVGTQAFTHETGTGPETNTGPNLDVGTAVECLGEDMCIIHIDEEDTVMVEHDDV